MWIKTRKLFIFNCYSALRLLTANLNTMFHYFLFIYLFYCYFHPQPASCRSVQWSPRHHEPADFIRDSFRQHQCLPTNCLWPSGREGAVQKHHPAHKPHHPAVPSRQGHHQAQPRIPGKHSRETRGLCLASQIIPIKEWSRVRRLWHHI